MESWDDKKKLKDYRNAIVRIVKNNLHKSSYNLMPCTFLFVSIYQQRKQNRLTVNKISKTRSSLHGEVHVYLHSANSDLYHLGQIE